MVKSIPLLITLSFLTFSGRTQSLIGPASQTISSSAVIVSWSLGEPVIGTASNEKIISMGFQQVFADIISGIASESDQPISLYPNPAKNQIQIRLDTETVEVRIEVRSVTDALVLSRSLVPVDGTITVDVTQLSPGLYNVLVGNARSGQKKLRFIKL